MSVGDARREVFFRDGGCVAPMLDPHAGPCYDEWGQMLYSSFADYEMDYVRLGSHGKRHELAIDHVQVCAGHHRGTGPSAGYQWATSHRGLLRSYLEACIAFPEHRRMTRGWGRLVALVLKREMLGT